MNLKITANILIFSLGLVASRGVHAAGAQPLTIDTTTNWYDTGGKPIVCECGNILKFGGIYYWYGYNAYVDGHNGDINCYTSTNLVQWTFASVCYDGHGHGWHGRPKVVYNQNTRKFVMISEGDGGHPGNALAYFTADNPAGPFVYQRTDRNIFGVGMGDHSIFQNADGTVYLLCASHDERNTAWNLASKIVKLKTDYLELDSVVAAFNAFTNGYHREAPAMLKVRGRYYYFSSHTSGWPSSETKYLVSTNLARGWSGLKSVNTTPYSTNSFNTQHNSELAVQGADGAEYYYYGGDRWSHKTKVGRGLYGFYPMTFDDAGIPTIHGYKQWTLDEKNGGWWSSDNNGGIVPDGVYKIINRGCDRAAQASERKTELASLDGKSDGRQDWYFFHQAGNRYLIQNVQSGQALAPAGGPSPGTNPTAWLVTALPDGSYRLSDEKSGYCLGAASSPATKEIALEQGSVSGQNGERWVFQKP